jgi:hypothetical protein
MTISLDARHRIMDLYYVRPPAMHTTPPSTPNRAAANPSSSLSGTTQGPAQSTSTATPQTPTQVSQHATPANMPGPRRAAAIADTGARISPDEFNARMAAAASRQNVGEDSERARIAALRPVSVQTLLQIQRTLRRTTAETGRFGVMRTEDARLETQGLRPASHYLQYDGTFRQAGQEALSDHDQSARHMDGDRLSWLRTHVAELQPEARSNFIEAQSTRDRHAGQRGLSHYMNLDGSLRPTGVQRLRSEEQADRGRRPMHADEIRGAQSLLRGLEAEAQQEGNAGLQTEMWLQLCAYLRRNGIRPRQPAGRMASGVAEEMQGKAFVTERGESTKKGKQVKRSEGWSWSTMGMALAAAGGVGAAGVSGSGAYGGASGLATTSYQEENIFSSHPFNFRRPGQPSPPPSAAGRGEAEHVLPEYEDPEDESWIQPPPSGADEPPSY